MKKICYPPGHKLFKNAWDPMSVKLFLKEMRLRQDSWLLKIRDLKSLVWTDF